MLLPATQLMLMLPDVADPTGYMIYVPALSWRRFFTFICWLKIHKVLVFHRLDKSWQTEEGS